MTLVEQTTEITQSDSHIHFRTVDSPTVIHLGLCVNYLAYSDQEFSFQVKTHLGCCSQIQEIQAPLSLTTMQCYSKSSK